MKRATILGGFTGFLIAMIAGCLAQRDPLLLMLDSCVASAVGGALFQWWHRMLSGLLRSAAAERGTDVPSEESSAATEGNHTAAT